MQISSEEFKKYLSNINFASHGDGNEINYGHYIVANFPNCEVMWRNLVVPMTERINGYPKNIEIGINFRENIDSRISELSNIHYSLFMNLLYAHFHYEGKFLCSLENIITHLGTCCDLAESFLIKWFILLSLCNGKKTKTIQELTEEEFLNLARKFYTENYPNLYEHYTSKGKGISIRLPTDQSIIKEYFGNKTDIYRKLVNTMQVIREYRNTIVHNIIVGKLIFPNGEMAVPKPEKILSYKIWDSIRSVANNPDIIKRDFSGIWDVAISQITALETILNSVWDIVINEFVAEFYTDQRTVLRDLYGIIFSEKAVQAPYVIDNNHDQTPYLGTVSSTTNVTNSAGTAIMPSGIITSGSPVIPIRDNESGRTTSRHNS